MTTRNNGGPAFPRAGNYYQRLDGATVTEDGELGMSLRDWFAGMALQGMAASSGWESNFDASEQGKLKWLPEVAKVAYAAADAMLEARKL